MPKGCRQVPASIVFSEVPGFRNPDLAPACRAYVTASLDTPVDENPMFCSQKRSSEAIRRASSLSRAPPRLSNDEDGIAVMSRTSGDLIFGEGNFSCAAITVDNRREPCMSSCTKITDSSQLSTEEMLREEAGAGKGSL